MKLHLLIYGVYSLCLWTVHSQDATHNVTGPDYLVTDGTRSITLTCQSETPLVDRYVWATPGTETNRCKRGTPTNVCTFTPSLEDDKSKVTCLLLDSQGVTLSPALYMINLKYPPQSSPNITIEPSRTEPLEQGDVITCTVTGGKPRVSSVIIYCQYPEHKDQEDVVSDDITVTSSIMVNTSQSTDVNTTCTCYANWPPESGLYTDRTVMSLQLEYKAKVTNVTINGTTELTLNETSHSTVIFACQGDGRPPPVLRLFKQGGDTALIQAEINADTQQLVYTIDNVRGEELASYTCEADNGFQDLSTRTVLLWVNSAPRMVESYDSSNPPTLPTEGLTFTLVAYPDPEYKETNFLGNGNVTTSEPAPVNTFDIQFTRSIVVEHLVNCHVTPRNVPKEKVGLYKLTVSNGLGDASFRFRVESPVTPPPEDVSIQTGVIVGAVLGISVIVIIVIIVIYLRRRKMKAGHKGHQGSQTRNQNNVPVTNTMSTFAAAHDSRPDSTATTTYDKINDGPSSAGCNTTAARCSTDSKGYASVGDASLQGSNKAAPTRSNNVPTTGYEDVELDTLGAPKIKNTPEKPKVDASIPEDSAERITDPKDYVYAKVAPKQKGDN